ncbi:hypothetical protein KXQ82_06725 [Mucilaginibacter sp. HMF5004]|uniref:hypothetical protein n=1 Tax=Mucilaginibacter rivuli TaxID=2857527 RepID=UPI001C5DCD16|nr:hypothetical protein [Mucilaginibacter rivuli]MBW4889400.1 hypothetical protein [Mucilaginibacter rivuli]
METLQQFIRVAGLAQIVLAGGSIAIPGVLKWREQLSHVRPLIRQMFWTYAAYIFVINLCFGLVSLFAYRDITNTSTLSTLVTGFIALYWISRVLVQFLYFDRSDFPKGKLNQLAEVALVLLFITLSVIYSWAFYINLKQLN